MFHNCTNWHLVWGIGIGILYYCKDHSNVFVRFSCLTMTLICLYSFCQSTLLCGITLVVLRSYFFSFDWFEINSCFKFQHLSTILVFLWRTVCWTLDNSVTVTLPYIPSITELWHKNKGCCAKLSFQISLCGFSQKSWHKLKLLAVNLKTWHSIGIIWNKVRSKLVCTYMQVLCCLLYFYCRA